MDRIVDTIQSNIETVKAQISAACQAADRDESEVKLVAVSKKHSIEKIKIAHAAGLRHFGENRVEEFHQKKAELADYDIVWHMIGHVQSRKARDVINDFHVIHSLESLKLARRYDNFFDDEYPAPQILLEMNVSGEDAKYGIAADDWQQSTTQREQIWDFVKALQEWPSLNIAGLMTMAPYGASDDHIRQIFSSLRSLQNALKGDFPEHDWQELSMGMTNDFHIAIQEGATYIRVGTAIFGERHYD